MGTFFGNSKGFSLTEMMVAGGVATIVTIAATQITTDVFKTQKAVLKNDDVSSLQTQVGSLFSQEPNCSRSFGQTGPNYQLNSTTRTSDLMRSDGTPMFKTDGSQWYMNNSVRITGWRFEQIQVLSTAPRYMVIGRLSMDMEKSDVAGSGPVGGKSVTTRMVPMVAELTGPGGTIRSCAASVSMGMPNLWLASGNDIYFTTGSVGIGNAGTPLARLSVVESGDSTKILARNSTSGFQVGLGTNASSAFVDSGNTDLVLTTNGVERLRVGAGTGNISTPVGVNILTPSFAIRGDGATSADRPYTRGGADFFVLAPGTNVPASTMYLAYPPVGFTDTVNTRIQETLFISSGNQTTPALVGIGAGSAGAKLHITAGASPGLRIDSTGDDIQLLTQKDHVIRFDTGAQNNNGISFWNESGFGTIFKISSNGRVGVNQGAPSQALDVNGNISSNASVSGVSFSANNFCIGGNCRSTFATQTCPAGRIATTINVDGTISCTDVGVSMNQTGVSCPAGQYFDGTDGAGNPICVSTSVGCAPNQYVSSYNISTGAVTCSTVPPNVTIPPCPAAQYLSAINSGSGVCSYVIPNFSCPAGQGLVSIVNGSVTCGAEAQNSQGCGAGQKITGFTAAGLPICANEAQNNVNCGSGARVTGFDGNGTPICNSLPTVNASCSPEQKVTGFNASGGIVCAPEDQNNKTCSGATSKLMGFDASGNAICGTENQVNQACGASQILTGFSATGSPLCTTVSTSLAALTEISVALTCTNGGQSFISCGTGTVRSCGVSLNSGGDDKDGTTCQVDVAANGCYGRRDIGSGCDPATLFCYCSGGAPPLQCGATTIPWTVSATCNSDVSIGPANAGTTAWGVDTVGPSTGAAEFQCDAGGNWVTTPLGGATCANAPAPCAAGTLSWTDSGTGQTCSAAFPTTNEGVSTAPQASTNGNNGSAAFYCNTGGTWASNPNAGATCSAPSGGGPCDCPDWYDSMSGSMFTHTGGGGCSQGTVNGTVCEIYAARRISPPPQEYDCVFLQDMHTCPYTPPPSTCTGGVSVSWDNGGPGTTCTGTTPSGIGANGTGSVTDSTGPDTGTGNFTCTAGLTWNTSALPTSTCTNGGGPPLCGGNPRPGTPGGPTTCDEPNEYFCEGGWWTCNEPNWNWLNIICVDGNGGANCP